MHIASCSVIEALCTVLTVTLHAEGLIICHGHGCVVTFTNVHFIKCPVIVLGGAKVLFSECTFVAHSKDKEPEPSAAIFAHGDRTSVSVITATFDGDQTLRNGVMVQNGASGNLEKCVFFNMRHAAVEVHDVNSSMNLDDVVINGAFLKGTLNYGVLAHGGSFLTSNRVSVSQAAVGYIAKNSATCILKHTTVSMARITGAIAVGHSNLSLYECVMKENSKEVYDFEEQFMQMYQELDSASLMGSGATAVDVALVSAVKCEFLVNSHMGVCAKDLGIATVLNCRSVDNSHGGFATFRKSIVLVHNSFASKSRYGFFCSASGSSSVHSVSIEGCEEGCALEGPNEGNLFNNYTVKQCTKSGFTVKYPSSVVKLRNCYVSLGSEGAIGFLITKKGRAVVEDSTLQCSAYGAHVSGTDSSLILTRSKLSADVGVLAEDAHVKLEYCETSQCAKSGVLGKRKSAVKLSHCVIRNDRVGVILKGGLFSIEDSKIRNCYVGIALHSEIALIATINRCHFSSHDPSSCGLRVTGEVMVRMEMRFCKFSGSEVAQAPSRAYENSFKECGALWKVTKCSGMGVHFATANSIAQVQKCNFVGHAGWGVLNSGAQLLLDQCHCAQNVQGGYKLLDRGSLEIARSSSYRDGQGCCALFTAEGDSANMGNTKLTKFLAREVLVHHAKQSGFNLSECIEYEIKNCCAIHCGEQGIALSYLQHAHSPGKAAGAFVADSVCKFNSMGGVLVYHKAQGSFKNVLSRRNCGSGFRVEHAGSKLVLRSCESSLNDSAYDCDNCATLRTDNCIPETEDP